MESVDIETKKKQHYVPQFYLKNWLSHEGIWVKNSIGEKSKIYLKKNTTDIA
ncbi:DUF4238 domain-containing protein, partial [Klebsiella pneumoniae]|uniref:DUF4238 domain-containing protein n=1 Tax=Klebsiella pneumoniae TaxID=573 RepID=UPI001C62D651